MVCKSAWRLSKGKVSVSFLTSRLQKCQGRIYMLKRNMGFFCASKTWVGCPHVQSTFVRVQSLATDLYWKLFWTNSAADIYTLIQPVESKAEKYNCNCISLFGLRNLLLTWGWIGQMCSRVPLIPLPPTTSSKCNVIKEQRKYFVHVSVSIHNYTLKLLHCTGLVSVPGLIYWPEFTRYFEKETTSLCQSNKVNRCFVSSIAGPILTGNQRGWSSSF